MTLRLRWDEGDESLVDLSGVIGTFRIYEPLRRAPESFRNARVGDHGTDIVWTEEIDMSADTLWRLAQEQAGLTLSAADFRQWRERHAYTLDTAAAALGISRRMVAYYEARQEADSASRRADDAWTREAELRRRAIISSREGGHHSSSSSSSSIRPRTSPRTELPR
jgi:DNA-binding XRE family transcriptional regulator